MHKINAEDVAENFAGLQKSNNVVRSVSDPEMSTPFIAAPALPFWTQQLAGILPLTALIEFIDLLTKLHVFELAGLVPLWNWPVTPAGARLLLATADNAHACCLDRENLSTVLHCIDGRYGDCYPGSTPTTTRLIVTAHKDAFTVPNDSPNLLEKSNRTQALKVILLSQKPIPYRSQPMLGTARRVSIWRRICSPSVRYMLVSYAGWLCWVGAMIISGMCCLYLAAAYLILLPLTGLAIRSTHGGIRRGLLDEGASEFKRMIVATSNFNGTHWWLFYGGSRTLNSLLNKPLFRTGCARRPRLVRILLQALIACQWVAAVGSCALQDWNAIIVSIWLLFCALTSSYLSTPQNGVRDWLERDCNVNVTCIGAEFSSRRAMLSAMLYLNPDSKERRTSWINPILAPCAERNEWETALLDFIENGRIPFTFQ